jgi:DNA-binding XRE family transcriptional regulator
MVIPQQPLRRAPAIFFVSGNTVGMSIRQLGTPRHDALRLLLIERRLKARLSQEELGRRVGRNQRYISRIETGQHRVTVIDLIEIAEAVGFDPMAAVRRIVKAPRDQT